MQNPIRELLVKGISKNDIKEIAIQAANNEVLFADLIMIIKSDESTQAMKAAWVIGTASDMYKTKFVAKYSEQILDLILTKQSGGVVRELMKALSNSKLKETEQGRYLDFCFKQLNRFDVDVAVKYNSNKFILKMVKKHPDLKDEFINTLESLLDQHNDAWKRYTSKIIQKLKK